MTAPTNTDPMREVLERFAMRLAANLSAMRDGQPTGFQLAGAIEDALYKAREAATLPEPGAAGLEQHSEIERLQCELSLAKAGELTAYERGRRDEREAVLRIINGAQFNIGDDWAAAVIKIGELVGQRAKEGGE